MRLSCKPSSGVTLVELILAMILLSVVILTGISMEVGLRRLYRASDVESELMGEAGAILTFVSRKVHTSLGDATMNPVNNQTFGGQYIVYRIRRDANLNGRWDGVPPDGWDEFYYCRNWVGRQDELWYGRDGVVILMLSDHVVSFRIGNVTGEGCDGCSLISVTLRRDPGSNVNATNPEITLNTTAQVRGMSLR